MPPKPDRILSAETREHRDPQNTLSELFRWHHAGVYRFTLLMVGVREAAEDITQDSFLALHCAITENVRIERPRQYLFTTARNRCLNYLRDRKHNVGLEEISEPVWEPNYESKDTYNVVQTEIFRLRPSYREAFLLAELEGYSYAETAAILGVSESSVRNSIYRARQRLRAALGPTFLK